MRVVRQIIPMVSSLMLSGQSEVTLPFMQSVLQRDLYNPAAFQDKGWHIGLPSALYDVYHAGPAFAELIERDEGDPFIQASSLLNELSPEQDNLGVINWRIQTVKVKYTNEHWSFGFEHEIVSESDFTYPTELVELYVEGNQPYIGEEIEIGPDLHIENLNSFGFLISRRLGPLNLAIRPKLLTGVKLAYTPRSSARLHTNEDFYEITLSTDYLLYNVGVVNFEGDNLLNFEVDESQKFALFTPHTGFGLDGGIVWAPSDRLELGLSFTDLGSIHWNAGASSYASQDTRTYAGLSGIGLFSVDQIELEGALDSLRALFELASIDDDIKINRTPNYYGSVSYQITSSFRAGLQIQYNSRFSSPWVYAASFSTFFPSGLDVGATVSQKFDQFQLGFYGAVPVGNWLIFAALDNVLQGLTPVDSNQFNVRAGVNYHLQKK